MNKTIVMSSGGALMRYKKELSKLHEAGYDFFAFSTSFMYCVHELNMYPDYFAFIDPQSAMPALEHICRHKKEISTKVIFLDPIHTTLSYNEYINWYGTSPVGRENNFGGWQRLHELVKEVQDSGLAINMPCLSLKHIYNNKNQYADTFTTDIDLVKKDFDKRFSIEHVIIKNQLDPNFNEDKLTSIVLPILDKLKIYNISLIGFDCQGGRYIANLGDNYTLSRQPELRTIKSNQSHVHLPNANRGLEESKRSIKKYLPLWLKTQKFQITNLVEDKYTFLKSYIPYQSIKDLQHETSFTK
jgi:hypothetical protein